jgi:UDP-N-acetylglucosamine 2-epimerase (non-hydrolysing)
MKKLMVVVGTRPNFMKVTRFKEVAAARGDVHVELVHTGQHTDDPMSTVFFEQFGMRPDHWLGILPGTPTEVLARIMLALEPVVRRCAPDAMVVVGDVNSTLAAALTANRMGLALAHVEAGLRNGDMTMPEEVNRVITDRVARHLFVTEHSGEDNLRREGASPENIHLVGNTMIDTLVAFKDRIAADPVLERLEFEAGKHVLVTMHRPATVDDPQGLERMVDLMVWLAARYPVVFPLHPRTRNNLQRSGLLERCARIPGLNLCGPLAYFAFQKVMATSAFVLTDSGGIQEETTYLRIPCLTLRPNTERPITVTQGTNELITFDKALLAGTIDRIERGEFKKGAIPELWDGKATERVFEALIPAL